MSSETSRNDHHEEEDVSEEDVSEEDVEEDDISVESSDLETDSEEEEDEEEEESDEEGEDDDPDDDSEEDSLEDECSEEDSNDGSDTDSDEEEDSNAEEENENAEEEETDGLELLRLAKLRMSEQKEKENTEWSPDIDHMKEELVDDDQMEEDDAESEEEEEETEDETVEESDDEVEHNQIVQETPAKPIVQKTPLRPSTRSKISTELTTTNLFDSFSPVRSGSISPRRNLDRGMDRGVSLRMPEGENQTSIRRRQRDENAELWALLRHSQRRLISKPLVEAEKAVSRDVDSDIDSDSDEETGENDNPVKVSPTEESNTAFNFQDEKKCEDEVERDFEKENEELFELLQKSKQRLEDSARKKAEEAEKEAAADTGRRLTKNPYKDLQNLPDAEEENNENKSNLTQKDLLIAMAVAEEASRSGSVYFVTPAKDVLRSRDMSSFGFLIEDEDEQTNKNIFESPSSDDDSVLEEQNHFRVAYETLVTKLSDFKERAREIDAQQQYRAALRTAELVRQSSHMFFASLSPRKRMLNNSPAW